MTMVVAGLGVAGAWLLARAARRCEPRDRTLRLVPSDPRRLPDMLRDPLARALEGAGVELTPESACGLWLATVGAVALLSTAFAPALAVLTTVLALVGGPMLLHLARGRVERRYVAALPGALEHVATELRGGGTVADGVRALASGTGPLAADFRVVEARAALGLPLADALAAWPDGRSLAEVRAAAGGLALAADVGGPSADALDGLARSVRDRLGALAEARALATQGRLSAVVVGAAPIAYLVLSSLVDPGALAALVGTTTGRVCLALGLLLEALGVVWIRRIVRTVA